MSRNSKFRLLHLFYCHILSYLEMGITGVIDINLVNRIEP